MTNKIIGEPTPFPGAITEEVVQTYNDTCAVKSQQIIMKTFGIDISEDALAHESMIKGYYVPGAGSDPDLVGKLLNDHGISTHSAENANVYDLVSELAQGHKVIVGVDSSELWQPSWVDDVFGETADHALVVTGIDTSDPENVKVIITDPGTGDVAKEYPLDQFIDAWHDSNCFYVATDNAPGQELALPEMAGFDYTVGHIPFVCGMPYDMYVTMQQEFDIFHNDIIANLDMPTEVFDSELIAAQFDHMHDVAQMLQDAYSETSQAMQHMENANQLFQQATHAALFDYWNPTTMTSDFPADFNIDFGII